MRQTPVKRRARAPPAPAAARQAASTLGRRRRARGAVALHLAASGGRGTSCDGWILFYFPLALPASSSVAALPPASPKLPHRTPPYSPHPTPPINQPRAPSSARTYPISCTTCLSPALPPSLLSNSSHVYVTSAACLRSRWPARCSQQRCARALHRTFCCCCCFVAAWGEAAARRKGAAH